MYFLLSISDFVNNVILKYKDSYIQCFSFCWSQFNIAKANFKKEEEEKRIFNQKNITWMGSSDHHFIFYLCYDKVNIWSYKSEDGEEDLNVSELTVTHCHYTGWPDHDVPKYPTSMLGFLRRVRKLHPYSSDPLVVHCSAGVGRTGTFMTIDSMLQKIAAESSVNVLQFVKDMRKKRCSMVQTEVRI